MKKKYFITMQRFTDYSCLYIEIAVTKGIKINLPDKYKIKGRRINVEFREPKKDKDEFMACTTFWSRLSTNIYS